MIWAGWVGELMWEGRWERRDIRALSLIRFGAVVLGKGWDGSLLADFYLFGLMSNEVETL